MGAGDLKMADILIKQEWENRVFPAMVDNRILPCILERLDGTPARIRDKTSKIPKDIINRVLPGKWSIKEEIGHLIDLEPLWAIRIKQIKSLEMEMTAADMSNRKTHTACHNGRYIDEIVDEFEDVRRHTVEMISAFTLYDMDKYSFHPRLRKPMRIVDLAYFIAEHDDHHLAQITFLSNQ